MDPYSPIVARALDADDHKANTFTDSSGDIYTVSKYGDMIELERNWGGNTPVKLSFWAEDAAKIIALIAEAAK